MNETIDILLATYNSERYLRAQLDSLLAQTDGDWRLLVRDAASTDATRDILAEYAARDARIRLVETGPAAACANFGRLLDLSTGPYAMFCDHDDVWLPGKIARSRAAMRALEQETDEATRPLAVFGDAIVTDGDLRTVDPSSFHFQHLDPSRRSVGRLLFQNVAAGNTLLMNRALVDAARPLPAEAVMHDHWVMLVAALLGRIGLIPGEPQVLYRQHGDNVLGAAAFSSAAHRWRLLSKPRAIRARLRQAQAQGAALARRFRGTAALPPEAKRLLDALLAFPSEGWWRRRLTVVREGFWKNGFGRNVGLMIFL